MQWKRRSNIYFFCSAKEVDVGSLPSLEIHRQAGGVETDTTARKYWYYFVWCRFFTFYPIHHVNINPTFIWGRHAALISSTVRSDRAKPTKYVSPGSRPSLNSHLQEGQCKSKAASRNSCQGSNSSEHTKRLWFQHSDVPQRRIDLLFCQIALHKQVKEWGTISLCSLFEQKRRNTLGGKKKKWADNVGRVYLLCNVGPWNTPFTVGLFFLFFPFSAI